MSGDGYRLTEMTFLSFEAFLSFVFNKREKSVSPPPYKADTL